MKRIIVFLLFVLSISAYAQKYVPFPTKDAQWNVFYAYTWDRSPMDTLLLQYSIQGDTTISNVVYRKVCRNTGTLQHPFYKGIGGLREQDKRIYYTGYSYAEKYSYSDSEYLLYDFNKKVNDTIWYDELHLGKRVVDYIITKVDSIQIGNSFRKRYTIKHPYDFGINDNAEYIVEGIGNISSGIFGAITPIPTCSDCYQEWHFVCFSQNGETLYKNPDYVDCNTTRKWSEKKYLANDACWTYTISGINYQTYLNGDTVIAGISYKKVYNRLPMGNSSNSCPYISGGYDGAIREENGKIYANIDNQYRNYGDLLLYDFTVKVGDTIHVKFGNPDYLVVTKIDTVTLLNGEKRKRFIFPFNSWIEGIGSSYMLLQPQGDATTCMETSLLVCFKQNDIQMYKDYRWCSTGNCCDVTDGIDQNKQNAPSVKLSPNPITDRSILKWDSAEVFSILIVSDLLGKMVRTIDTRGTTEISLNRNDFDKGLYIGRLISTNGMETTVKIIVQ